MKFIIALLLILLEVSVCGAQGNPAENCSFPHTGFATMPDQMVRIAEVAIRAAVKLEGCDSQNGCVALPVVLATPILIYRVDGAWTCGYLSGRDGAGPAWIRSDALRILPYDTHPPLNAWVGTWTGGEDRVLIRVGRMPRMLRLVGNAKWHGRGDNVHFGYTEGSASPMGNHLHFVQDGTSGCTIDMTLLNRYILASDNGLCGGLNARFQGIWKRTRP